MLSAGPLEPWISEVGDQYPNVRSELSSARRSALFQGNEVHLEDLDRQLSLVPPELHVLRVCLGRITLSRISPISFVVQVIDTSLPSSSQVWTEIRFSSVCSSPSFIWSWISLP